jgi:hypothetical protein
VKKKFFILCILLLLFGTEICSAGQVAVDYSNYLPVKEVETITGQANLNLKSIDSKKSGEAYDLTYSTAVGQSVLMIQVLRGSDYDMYYNDFRCQDYKGMEYAFWGPKTATPENPPSQLWFRKGEVLIYIESGYKSDNLMYLDVEMMEKIAKIIASKL